MTEVLHWHHKVPRHAGGTDEPENLIQLTPQEHAEAHLALYLEHGRWQDWQAALWLSGQNNDKAYLSARNSQNRAKAGPRSEASKIKTSETLKRKFAEGTFQPGCSHAPKTKEHNKKNSEANKEKWASGERKVIKNPGPTSKEGREKCSQRAKARWDKWRKDNKK
jgi:hypothetical protein